MGISKMFLCALTITLPLISFGDEGHEEAVSEAVQIEIMKVVRAVAPEAPVLKKILAADRRGPRVSPEEGVLWFPAQMPENNKEWVSFVFLAGHEAGHMFIFEVNDLFLSPLDEEVLSDFIGVQYLFTHRKDLVPWLRALPQDERVKMFAAWLATSPRTLRPTFIRTLVEALLAKEKKICAHGLERALAEFLPSVTHGRETSPVVIRAFKMLDLCK